MVSGVGIDNETLVARIYAHAMVHQQAMQHVWTAAGASSAIHTSSHRRPLAAAPAAASRAGAGAGGGLVQQQQQQQARPFSKFKGGSLREKGAGGGVKGQGGKGGKAAGAEKGEGALEEELLTIDPAELELPPGTKTDSEW